jgi:hypothetical protein
MRYRLCLLAVGALTSSGVAVEGPGRCNAPRALFLLGLEPL